MTHGITGYARGAGLLDWRSVRECGAVLARTFAALLVWLGLVVAAVWCAWGWLAL